MKLITPLLVFITTIAVHAVDISNLVRAGLVLPDTVLQHQSELDISPDQAERLHKLADATRKEGQGLEATVKQEQDAFDALVKNLETSQEAALAQLDKLLTAEGALKQLQLRTLLKLRDALSPEQRKRALKIGSKEAILRDPVESRLKEKGLKVRTAFESLGIRSPKSLTAKAEAIESLVHEGRLAEAEKGLDDLIKETGVNEPVTAAASIDFGTFEPGSIEVSTLQQRYTAVEEKAAKVTHLPTLKLLLHGRDELEKAKASEDATKVGRILTWAEGILGKVP